MRDWTSVPFRELMLVPTRNGIHKGPAYQGRGTPIIKMGEVYTSPYVGERRRDLFDLTASEQRKTAVQEGDLLFCRTSLVADGVGRCAIVKPLEATTSFASNLIRVRLDPARVDWRYAHSFFMSPGGRDLVRSISRGTSVTTITGPDLADLPVPLPPLSEQRAIGALIRSLDDKVEANRVLVRALRDLARQELASAQTDRTDRLGNLAEIRRGIAYTSSGLGRGGLPMVNLANADNYGWLKRSGTKPYSGPFKPRHIAKPGSLLLTGVEQSWSNEILGWPMLVPNDFGPALFSQDLFIVDFRPDFAWSRLPVWGALFETDSRSFLEGHTYGSTIARIPREAFENLVVRLPKEDDDAIERADASLRRAWAAETETLGVQDLRDTLVPGLFSGRLRVRHSETPIGAVP